MHSKARQAIMLACITVLAAAAPLCSEAQTQTETDKDLVVIVHGFWRTARHMRFLKQELAEAGYVVYAPSLPTWRKTVDDCAAGLAENLVGQDLDTYRQVHFVGHSMGGLIIRQYLADHELPNIGNVVLIGSPNKGTDLGGIVNTWLKPLTWLSPAYESFEPGGKTISPPKNDPPPSMGAIAGTKSDLLLGWMIEGVNDGRVPLDAVPFPGMRDFLVLPFHHDKLPYRPETAAAVRTFLKTGWFNGAPADPSVIDE